MKAYKITGGTSPALIGRFFIPYDNQVLLAATPTLPQTFYDKWTFGRLQERGELQEVDLLNERWLHHHLYKPIQQEVRKLVA